MLALGKLPHGHFVPFVVPFTSGIVRNTAFCGMVLKQVLAVVKIEPIGKATLMITSKTCSWLVCGLVIWNVLH
jgi:hypothetical protein